LSDGVLNNTSGSFNREKPPLSHDFYSNNSASQLQFQPMTMNTLAGDVSSKQHVVTMNEDVVNDILAATHAMPSWKACQMEGTTWTGTGEENIKKYVSSIGVQDRCPESDS